MFEALTLMQTGKGRQMPIDENECGLLPVVNEPREVTDAIFDFHEMRRGFTQIRFCHDANTLDDSHKCEVSSLKSAEVKRDPQTSDFRLQTSNLR